MLVLPQPSLPRLIDTAPRDLRIALTLVGLLRICFFDAAGNIIVGALCPAYTSVDRGVDRAGGEVRMILVTGCHRQLALICRLI